jgi:hypothetical protein
MIGLEDRQSLSQEIGAAHAAGARLHLACEVAGIDLRTLQRWKAHEGLTAGDGRPQAVRPLCSLNVGSMSGCSTCKSACWISLSTAVGIPRSRVPPPGLGMPTRRTAEGR